MNETGRRALRAAGVAAVVGAVVGTLVTGSVAGGLGWGVGAAIGVLLGLLGYDAYRRSRDGGDGDERARDDDASEATDGTED